MGCLENVCVSTDNAGVSKQTNELGIHKYLNELRHKVHRQAVAQHRLDKRADCLQVNPRGEQVRVLGSAPAQQAQLQRCTDEEEK